MSDKPIVKITNWSIARGHLFGDAYEHPRFPDGTFVQTSKIVSQEGKTVETLNTIYELIGKELQL
jgi:hypothetical protein